MGLFLMANKALLPEMLLFVMSMVTLMCAVFVPAPYRKATALVLTQAALWGAIALAICFATSGTVTLFSETVVFDHLSLTLKIISYALASGLCLYAYHYLQSMKMPVPEFYVLTLLSVLGLSTLLSANHFITLYVGLELMSLPLYAMIAMRRNAALCLEAAIKYFVIGAIATGILLYGITLLYGATQSLAFAEVAQAMPAALQTHHLLVTFAMVFITLGVGFKLGTVPCHMWLPDVYEGAPTIMTMMVATLAKIAALGMLLRLLIAVLPAMFVGWQPLILVLVVLSLFVGNVTAVKQVNLKPIYFLMGEDLYALKIAGITLIFIGVILIYKEPTAPLPEPASSDVS